MSRICNIHKIIQHERMINYKDKIELYCPECEIDKLWAIEKKKHETCIKEVKKGKFRAFFISAVSILVSLLFWQTLYHSFWYWGALVFISSYVHQELTSKPFTKTYDEIKSDYEQIKKEQKEKVFAFKSKKHKEYKKVAAGISDLDRMNGFEFEEYVADLLRKLKYKNVKVTRKTGDNGVDILAEKGSRKYAIQCKRNNPNNKLSNAAIQQVFTGKQLYKCTHAMVITTSYFTKPAWDTGKELGVTLWTRNKLIEKISEVSVADVTFDQYIESYYAK